MIDNAQKQRIRLYSTSERGRIKSAQRRRDAADAARGNAAELQEKNRALPPVSDLIFDDREDVLPTE